MCVCVCVCVRERERERVDNYVHCDYSKEIVLAISQLSTNRSSSEFDFLGPLQVYLSR